MNASVKSNLTDSSISPVVDQIGQVPDRCEIEVRSEDFEVEVTGLDPRLVAQVIVTEIYSGSSGSGSGDEDPGSLSVDDVDMSREDRV